MFKAVAVLALVLQYAPNEVEPIHETPKFNFEYIIKCFTEE